MENGYLGGIILAASILSLALICSVYRKPRVPAALDNDDTATMVAFLVTAFIALGLTVFAGNAYLTDTFSTIVSSGIVLASLVVLAVAIARSVSLAVPVVAIPAGPEPTSLPPAANSNVRASRRTTRLKAA